MFVVPDSYCLYSKCHDRWVSARALANSTTNQFECWNGAAFVPVVIDSCDTMPTRTYKADSVTVVGCDFNVLIDFQWKAIWNKPSDIRVAACARGKHVLLALSDFCISSRAKDLHTYCKIPKSRLKALKPWLPTEVSVVPLGKRYCEVKFPTCVLEGLVCDTANNSDHAKAYIQTVLNICGSIVPRSAHGPAHIKVSDCGMRRKPEAFRKLRRTLFMCGVRNHYACRVFVSKNGKNKLRRQARISLHNAHPLPKVKYFPLQQTKVEEKTNWVMVHVSDGNSMVIEGIRFSLNEDQARLKISIV